ncbi:MAG TPA: sugar transferase [Solirubrobacteraceae bacterium]
MATQEFGRIRELDRAVVVAGAPTPGSARTRWPGWGLRRLLALGDAIAVSIAIIVALKVFGSQRGATSWVALATVPLWIPLFKVYGLYDRDGKRVSHSTLDDVPHVFHALVMGTLGLWSFYKIGVPGERLILRQSLACFGTGFAAVLLVRGAVRGLAARLTPPERIVIVGDEDMSRLLMRKIRAHPEYGLDPIGYVAIGDSDEHERDGFADAEKLVAEVERVCSKRDVERVLAVAPAVNHAELAELIRRMRTLKIRVSVVPDFVDALGPSVEIDDIEGITVLGINPPALTRSSRAIKRAMDIAIALPVAAISLPVLAVVAIAIKLGSPGPVFYSQLRVGRDGSRFRLYKFRTMVPDADARAEELKALSAHPAWLLLEKDPRITRVGGFLRRASLDELPQLWNVLKGDMSLVGPRPMSPSVHDHISGWGLRRLDLTPGLTGLWQVLGRTSIPFEEMVKLDYVYTTNWSLWYDVRLLIRTLPAVVRQRGAN